MNTMTIRHTRFEANIRSDVNSSTDCIHQGLTDFDWNGCGAVIVVSDLVRRAIDQLGDVHELNAEQVMENKQRRGYCLKIEPFNSSLYGLSQRILLLPKSLALDGAIVC